ncbi:hypothetical protein TKK_0008274 [Trichogramma kaykai]
MFESAVVKRILHDLFQETMLQKLGPATALLMRGLLLLLLEADDDDYYSAPIELTTANLTNFLLLAQSSSIQA